MEKEKISMGKKVGLVIGVCFKFFVDLGIGIVKAFYKNIDKKDKVNKKNGKKKTVKVSNRKKR